MARRIFIILTMLEALSIIPLAYFLSSSELALVLAVGMLMALNASAISAVGNATRTVLLHFLNVIVCGIGLVLALIPEIATLWMSVGVVGFLCLFQFVVGHSRLADGTFRGAFAAQQLAIGSTLIVWMIVHRSGFASDAATMRPDHLRTGLRLLFGAPFAFVAIVFIGKRFGWTGLLIALAGASAGQWGAGFLELGAALQLIPLIIIGLIFLGVFLVLLVFAVVPRRRS